VRHQQSERRMNFVNQNGDSNTTLEKHRRNIVEVV